jgi:magnesium chelatase family protein
VLARVQSEALSGLDSHAVAVEADVVAAAPAFTIVGLPDAAVQESRERVRTAIVNSDYEFPSRRITVNLAPADVRKEGPSFDLPIALALLCATGQSRCSLAGAAAIGELSLDGAIRPVAGVLAVAQSAHRRGLRALLVPSANAREAALVTGLEVLPAATLREAAALLAGAGGPAVERLDPESLLAGEAVDDADLHDVLGQSRVKRVLEVAVAGAHNLLMVGPPGSGKTMLARRVASIMPPLSVAEAIDVTRVYSVAGMLAPDVSLVVRRPFRGGGGGAGPGRPTTRSRRAGSWVAASRRAPARSAWPTSACCSSTSSPSFAFPPSKACASRSKTARSPSRGRSPRSPSRRASCWWPR